MHSAVKIGKEKKGLGESFEIYVKKERINGRSSRGPYKAILYSEQPPSVSALVFAPAQSQTSTPDQTKHIAAANPIFHHVRHPRCFRLRRQFSSETFPCHWIISPVNQIKSNLSFKNENKKDWNPFFSFFQVEA
jgi:hypothetical protein